MKARLAEMEKKGAGVVPGSWNSKLGKKGRQCVRLGRFPVTFTTNSGSDFWTLAKTLRNF